MARRVNESDWTAINAIRKANPDWSFEMIGNAVGFGADVVSRAIRTVSYDEYKLLVKSLCYRKPKETKAEEEHKTDDAKHNPNNSDWQEWYDGMISQMMNDAKQARYELEQIHKLLAFISDQLK